MDSIEGDREEKKKRMLTMSLNIFIYSLCSSEGLASNFIVHYLSHLSPTESTKTIVMKIIFL